MSDDDGDLRHQRFVLQLQDRQTVLLAHNLGIAERVPAGMGSRVYFRGIYEWNELGGLVHWTHRDPMGVAESGWVRYRRKVYD